MANFSWRPNICRKYTIHIGKSKTHMSRYMTPSLVSTCKTMNSILIIRKEFYLCQRWCLKLLRTATWVPCPDMHTVICCNPWLIYLKCCVSWAQNQLINLLRAIMISVHLTKFAKVNNDHATRHQSWFKFYGRQASTSMSMWLAVTTLLRGVYWPGVRHR